MQTTLNTCFVPGVWTNASRTNNKGSLSVNIPRHMTSSHWRQAEPQILLVLHASSSTAGQAISVAKTPPFAPPPLRSPGATSITRCSWQLANREAYRASHVRSDGAAVTSRPRSWRSGERQNLHESLLVDPTSALVLVRRQGLDVEQKPVRLQHVA